MTFKYGSSYSNELRHFGETRFATLKNSPVDVTRVKMISLIENSQTTEAIQGSRVLSGMSRQEAGSNRDQLFAALKASPVHVILLLTHITEHGMVELRDGDVPLAEIGQAAHEHSVPLLVVGCRSARFLTSGYKGYLNSIEMVGRIDHALGSAHSFGDLVSGFAHSDEALVLDWEFLQSAHDTLRVRLVGNDGGELGVVYLYGFQGWIGAPPKPSGLALLAAKSGWAFWVWRGVAFAAGLLVLAMATARLAPEFLDRAAARTLGYFEVGCAVLALIGIFVATLYFGGTAGLVVFFSLIVLGMIVWFLLFVKHFRNNPATTFGRFETSRPIRWYTRAAGILIWVAGMFLVSACMDV